MNSVRFILSFVLPYLSWAVFVLGLTWRTGSWLRRPVPVSITLLPGPSSRVGRAAAMASELLGFRSLWRGDRRLWLAAWLTHLALAVVLAGHVAGIATLAGQFCWLGASAATSVLWSKALGLAGGSGLLVLLAILALRRVTIPELRRLSDPSDYFALALLLAVAGTGMALRLAGPEVDLAAVRGYLAGLIVLRPVELPAVPLLVTHLTLFHILLLYFPFSKLMHVTGGIVSRELVLRPAPVYPTPAGFQPDAGFRRL